jgi:arginine repressor
MVAAMFEFARGPNLRHQHEAPKTEAVRPYKDAILQALRKTTLEEIARLLTKGGVEISKPQLARAVQLFKKESRAERAGTRSPTTQSSRDPKLHQLAAELLAHAQGPSRRYPHPAPKQDQLRQRREQLLEDRKQGKTIPEIVQELRRQGINISHAQALRIITLFQKEELAGRSTYNPPKALEPLAVREEPLKDAPQVKPEPTSKAPAKPKASASAKAREDDLQNTIKQARRSAPKGQKSKLPPGNLERGKQGPSRSAPDR